MIGSKDDNGNYIKGNVVKDFLNEDGKRFKDVPLTIYVEPESPNQQSSDGVESRSIIFNPSLGIEYSGAENDLQAKGGALSPAMLLLHEFGHQWLEQLAPNETAKDKNSPSKNGLNKHEDKVMFMERTSASQFRGEGNGRYYHHK